MSEKKRILVVGDLHGNYKGFMQALERSSFDYNSDHLISLGDIADGYSQVPEIIEEFRKIKNLTWVLGNHDEWVQNWMRGRTDMAFVGIDGDYNHPLVNSMAHMWLSQGGKATYNAYMTKPHLITEHRDFWLNKPVLYYRMDDIELATNTVGGKCFVHGGFNREYDIHYQSVKTPHVLYWDRNLWNKALSVKDSGMILKTVDKFEEIFIGHTATTYWGTTAPMNSGGVWNLDTGAGWSGKVTIMDVYTKQYWQSDLAEVLYPGERPRK